MSGCGDDGMCDWRVPEEGEIELECERCGRKVPRAVPSNEQMAIIVWAEQFKGGARRGRGRMSRGLTPKQDEFCRQFVVDLCATQAAVRAGYAESGARTEGARLLAKANIQARIAELQAERSRRTDIKADDVLRRLIREADAGDLNEPNAARIRAVELLGKHLGLFVDRKIIGIRALPLEDLNEAELAVLLGKGAPSPEGRLHS